MERVRALLPRSEGREGVGSAMIGPGDVRMIDHASRRTWGRAVSALALAAWPVAAPGAGGSEADAGARDLIVVVATPLGDEGVLVADSGQFDRSRAASLAEQLARTAPGVTLAEVQGNPLQPDISYRGFTASPVLGTPQGLAVYLDGVRINQPFGDVVSWDLLPPAAIARAELVTGAATPFGRNALGGAIVLRTKDGRSDPGMSAQASLGSFGRATATAQAGGAAASGLDWLVLGDHFRESGWRDFSPSRATRGLVRLGWQGARDRVALTLLGADTDLTGNGLQEEGLLAADRRSIYTAPDTTRNRAGLVALNATHESRTGLTLRANAFWRGVRTRTLNGDVNEETLGGAAIVTPAQCRADVAANGAPNASCNGLLNRSRTRQGEWGGGIEAALAVTPLGIAQQITVGASFVRSRSRFAQTTQFGILGLDRRVVAVDGPGAFADGSQASDDAFDARVDLRARTVSFGIYALDTVTLARGLRLDLSARFDRTAVRNRDRITPGGGLGSLDSDPVYSRLNPGAALHWTAAEGIDLSLAWSQASRAPSAIELGCSDPESPCRLPNALAGDPPLRQVIARTTELAARLDRDGWSLRASLFRTDSDDDILFVADEASGFGYFRNFGRTRRQGAEVQADAQAGPLKLRASYTFLDATYRSPETVNGASNSSNDGPAPGFDGAIEIAPGNHIPLLPRHVVKAVLDWAVTDRLSLTLDGTAVSGSIARGNENNAHQPDGIYYLGRGRTRGYGLVNLGGEFRAAPALTLFATVRNLTGARYATAAQLGATAFDSAGGFVARPFAGPVIDGETPRRNSSFLAPGAPRAIEAGARLRF